MQSMHTLRKKLTPLPYVLPALITIGALSLFPMGYTVYLAFTNYSASHLLKFNWVGLANFKDILLGPTRHVFFPVLGWTVTFAVLSVASQYLVGLTLAVLLNNKFMRESNVYRAILILPWALPSTVMIMSFASLFNTDYGQFNYALEKLLHLGPIPWLTQPSWAQASMVLMNLWFGFPFYMTVLLGGLQSIPSELFEAAEIDGATRWQQFRTVTLPILWRVSLPVVIASAAFNFNNISTAYLLTGGGPPRPGVVVGGYTDILASMAFKYVHDTYLYALASALSVILFVLVAGFSVINMKYTGAFQEVD